jgi:hypothetical protein
VERDKVAVEGDSEKDVKEKEKDESDTAFSRKKKTGWGRR